MGFLKRAGAKGAAVTTQIRSGSAHPFGMFENYVPLGGGDTRLYRAIREAVPVLDAAVMKLIRLTGGFEVSCGDGRAEQELGEFLKTVNAGRGQRGIQAFLDNYMDSLLTSGRAVGEIALQSGGEIAALLCGNVADVQVKEGVSPLDFVLCGRGESGGFEEFPYGRYMSGNFEQGKAMYGYGAGTGERGPFI